MQMARVYAKSTRVTNLKEAQQIESAWKTNVARAVVGLPSHKPVPLLEQFITKEFLPFLKRHPFKTKTRVFYKHHASILSSSRLGSVPLDTITTKMISMFAAERRKKFAVSSVNRDLAVLRRILKLAVEWEHVGRVAKVLLLPGEARRERVITEDEEKLYLEAAAPLLKDVAALLFDLGLRPDELFRLKPDQYRDGFVEILTGKGRGSRRKVPCSDRVKEILERRIAVGDPWIFPAPTKDGHIGPSSIKKQHAAAIKKSKVPTFVVYSIRHTCLTRWSKKVDAFTLQYLAGHVSISTTQRYIHIDPDRLRGILK